MFDKFIVNLTKPLIFLIGVLSFSFASVNAQWSKESFLFCLKKDVNPLTINKINNSISVDIDVLNNFINDEEIVNIESWIPGATDMDKDGDIYLNRIYRVYVNETKGDDIPRLINKLQEMPFIHYSEFEYLRKLNYSPNDPLSGAQCTLSSIKTKKAWDFWDIESGSIPDGRNVLLASVDTGVDYTHPDLQENAWINQGEIPSFMFEAGVDLDSDGYISASEVVAFLQNDNYDVNNDGEINLRDAVSDGSPFEDNSDNDGNGYTDDLLGWDSSGWYGPDDNDPFPKEDVDPSGTWGHGTHVAGILAAVTDNDLGMASTSYNAKFISVKVSRENQTGDEPGISDGYAGITYAAKAGLYSGSFTIINNSWGGGGYSNSEDTVINVAQDTYGAIILGAAGNGYDAGGEQYGSHYPSSYDNCISVCAIGCSYAWGNWATYHYTVDLAAPGESIYSTVIGSGYDSWDGSSMACPNAASAIGLLSAYHPDWSNLQLRSRIEESADRKIYEDNPDYEACNGNFGEDCLGSGMVDIYKAIGMDFSPNIMVDSSYVQTLSDTDSATLMDDDNVLNPGETASLIISLENEIGWVDASSVVAVLSTDNEYITIPDNTKAYGSIDSNDTGSSSFEFIVDDGIDLGEVVFSIDVTAVGSGGYEYSNSLDVSVDVSLHQVNFPYDTNSELRAAPVIADLDNDGDNDIVMADYFGNVRVIVDGEELNNESFPYDTGDQIWGSVSSADLDLDGLLDFVVASKNGHLYIFDINGLKVDYNAERYLVATPVIGNIDDDSELEIVVGGYQSPTSTCPLFAINHDGSVVDGFPYVIGEKMKSGVALADMDGNGKDDIIFGTDGDNLYVLLDDLSIAPGFPVDLGNNLRSEPAVLDVAGEKVIFIGCTNNNFYAFNDDATLKFVIVTGDDVFTSPSFFMAESGVEIYFGSDDGNVYGVDINGNSLDGFPVYVNGAVVGSIVVADFDGDDVVNLVAANDAGEIHMFDRSGNSMQYFPVNYQFPFPNSPQILDYDLDGDLEIFCGSTGDLVSLDIKNNNGVSDGYWSIFKGDYSRSGYYNSEGQGGCSGATAGDINYDSIINVLDIVRLVNIVINPSTLTDVEACAADLNGDDIINVLDIVMLVNIVING